MSPKSDGVVLVVYRIAFIRQSEAKFVICLSKWSKAYRDKQRRASQIGGANVKDQAWPSYKIWLSHENIRVTTEEHTALRLHDKITLTQARSSS